MATPFFWLKIKSEYFSKNNVYYGISANPPTGENHIKIKLIAV